MMFFPQDVVPGEGDDASFNAQGKLKLRTPVHARGFDVR